MKSKIQLFILPLFLIVCFSCKEFETDFTRESNYRLKKITETNVSDNAVKIHYFTYEKDKLSEWKTCFIDENEQLQESKKLNFSYTNTIIEVIHYKKTNDEWEKHQLYKFTVQNHLIIEKLVSRYSFPECEQCWKYRYIYTGDKLTETIKYINSDASIWEVIEKNCYTYDGNDLAMYQYFNTSNDGQLLLDYSKIYTTENGICVSWEGGINHAGTDWVATQKIEFEYTQGLLSSEMYFIRNDVRNEWQNFGSVQYFYDENSYLIESLTSRGNGITYEYEKGKGNSEWFLDGVNEIVKPGIITW